MLRKYQTGKRGGGGGSMLRKHTWLAYFMLATLLIYHLFIQREAQTLTGTQG